MATARSLFEPELPRGFSYHPAFVTEAEEQALTVALADVEFSAFEMRGVVAKRRVAFFGQSYDTSAARPIPAFLLPLRARMARWTARDPEAFAMALINEYPAGAPIGWHRDAPQYEDVAGVSFLSACRMKFRPYRAPSSPATTRRSTTHEIELEPRAAYLMTGPARREYEHHIPPVAQLRYSVTFRTLR